MNPFRKSLSKSGKRQFFRRVTDLVGTMQILVAIGQFAWTVNAMGYLTATAVFIALLGAATYTVFVGEVLSDE
ncbi:MAG TPA: hypothetical protein VKA14_03165 [Gammaproteobacteria bacterium]|nr:hypothetical protein [Gammaproteobacteria bacterium]